MMARMLAAGWDHNKIADELNHLHGLHAASAFIVTCALFELTHVAQRDRWLSALRQEAHTAFRKERRAFPVVGDLAKLPLTLAVFKETLRLHAVTMGVVRRLGEDVTVTTGGLGGSRRVVLRPGTEVLMLLHALHTHPDHYSHAATFDPSRWVKAPGGRRGHSQGVGGGPGGAGGAARGRRRHTAGGARGGQGTASTAPTAQGRGSGSVNGESAAGHGGSGSSATGAGGGGDGSGSSTSNSHSRSGGGSSGGGRAAPLAGCTHSFFPFLGGPRMCGGQKLAELQFAVVLHTILGRVDVEVVPTLSRIPLRDSMFASVAAPIPCMVSRLAGTGSSSPPL